jgi:hypothetical protein
MNSTRYAFIILGLFACGDDNKVTPIDAKEPPMPDAPDVADFSWDEGGESRLEYQEVFTAAGPNIRTRATTFLFRAKTPKRYEFPLIPGCTKMDLDDRFPARHGRGASTSTTAASYGRRRDAGDASRRRCQATARAPVVNCVGMQDGDISARSCNVRHAAQRLGVAQTCNDALHAADVVAPDPAAPIQLAAERGHDHYPAPNAPANR